MPLSYEDNLRLQEEALEKWRNPWTPLDDALDQHVGKWVAVKGEQIVAVHDSAKALSADPASIGARRFRVKPRNRRYVETV